jgi:uncharacterized protein YbbC (DUF1343 family)
VSWHDDCRGLEKTYIRGMARKNPLAPMMFSILTVVATLWLGACNKNTPTKPQLPLLDTLVTTGTDARVRTGAEVLITERMQTLVNKRIAIVANNTSRVFVNDSAGKTGIHLVDTLHRRGIKIAKVFAPEHGFRGDQDAGAHVANSVDKSTGISIVSLFGTNKKPKPEHLKGIDLVIFDIQDVGARFYTYISTMSYVMEACAEQKIPMLILDRPNPNGWYVDGPVLEAAQKSFVGMHTVPVAHGMTIGEYALMVNGEGWLAGGQKCVVDVVRCKDYKHAMRWNETGLTWLPPSPNLSTEYSAYLYPMLCWFEGLKVSVGRGTPTPFEVLGAPWHKGYENSLKRDSILGAVEPSRVSLNGLEAEYIKFTPRSTPGKAVTPDFQDQVCYGIRFLNRVEGKELFLAGLSLLSNFVEESKNVGVSATLYQPSFNILIGNSILKSQLAKKMTPEAIYATWQDAQNKFKVKRKKYLLYPDFD